MFFVELLKLDVVSGSSGTIRFDRTIMSALFTEKFPSRSWDRGFGRSFNALCVGGGMFAADGSYCVFN